MSFLATYEVVRFRVEQNTSVDFLKEKNMHLEPFRQMERVV